MASKPGSPTPMQRLVRLLHPERRTINYIFVYAVIIGIFSLSLPLGITAVFNFLTNGAMYSSTYILIAFVLTAVIVGGVLLIGQLSLVEYIEQKLFLRCSLEFAYRLPRIKPQELEGENLVELVNRFFDVIVIQKGVIKLLIDLITAAVTIMVSLIILSFYHPLFIVLSVVTVALIIMIVAIYYQRGLSASIEESQHKYETVAYLEAVAEEIQEYRGDKEKMRQIIEDTDLITGKYLKARNEHFRVLKRFFASSVFLRTLLFGAMLLLGSHFVVERQMTFGQFVAAEVLIVQVGYAIEKLFTNLNTIFDMLTGSVKLGAVTDLALEEDAVPYGH
ncbi:ABC transporter transmembrane domain-containing protein [Sphingobacterium sp. lm-10]|uniref:ABC transporter transmembrane domain-containing protein n=1 Tax=Sphingobacterium sp. lm-10 TaxID=2944904 RepID=UPI002020ABC3|nr:ABC transporter transmembrane domain-containing protein [Sphingobacterium sp. lm-10]MCL7989084.1 ABC transporter transmembrane domain-containing protein [Sphingobacterium sp. lm-10]